jgi:GNAT superfamily N-acetyltransferase
MTSKAANGSTPAITIREARPADVARMFELLADSARAQGAPDALCVDADILRRDGFGAHPRFHTIVAEAGAEVVGLALYFFTFSTWTSVNGVHLEDLCVAPEWRRHGIARLLMRELVAIAAARGCRRFQWFVLRANRGAIAFYESLGATIPQEWDVMSLDVESVG